MQRWTWVHYIFYTACEAALQRRRLETEADGHVKKFVGGNVAQFDALYERLKKHR